MCTVWDCVDAIIFKLSRICIWYFQCESIFGTKCDCCKFLTNLFKNFLLLYEHNVCLQLFHELFLFQIQDADDTDYA